MLCNYYKMFWNVIYLQLHESKLWKCLKFAFVFALWNAQSWRVSQALHNL